MNTHVSVEASTFDDAARPNPGASTPTKSPARKRRSRRLRRRLLLLIVLIAAAAGGYYAYTTYFAPAETAAVTYVTSAVAVGDIEDAVAAVGTLAASESRIVETTVGARIATLAFDVGEVVAEGDIIATMEAAPFEADLTVAEAQLANLEAQLADREAQLDLAQQDLTRQEGLFAANAVAETAVQNARVGVISATAALESSRAQLAQQEQVVATAEEDLAATTIRAPISGTVVDLPVQIGQTVDPGTALLTLAGLSTMTVTAQVSEADVGRLFQGMEAYFTTLGGSEERWTGTLRQILPTPTVENNVVLYSLIFDVANPTGTLMIGMSAEAFFVVSGAEDVLTIPIAALRPAPRIMAPAAGAPAADAGGEEAVAAPAEGANVIAGGPAAGAQGQAPGAFTGRPPEGVTPEMIQQRMAQGGAAPGAGGGDGVRRLAPAPAAEGATTTYSVRVLHEDGTVEDRLVEIGVQDRVNAEVVSGLAAGEAVITATARPGATNAAPQAGAGPGNAQFIGGPGGGGAVMMRSF
ncbi:MAG: efflux RND transporter periplasmic adaptor subunit [Bauldia sp.]